MAAGGGRRAADASLSTSRSCVPLPATDNHGTTVQSENQVGLLSASAARGVAWRRWEDRGGGVQ